MKTIYLDSDFICHVTNDGTFREIETDIFDGQPDDFIVNFRLVPEGETWTRSDGVVFNGLMVSPIKDYKKIMTEVAISYLTDEQAEAVSVLYEEWAPGVQYYTGNRRQYYDLLYKCLQSHISQSDWTPDITSALWTRVYTEEWPEWVQPTGAHDAYSIGDKVSHNEKHWISDYDANIWEPGVFGWSEAQ